MYSAALRGDDDSLVLHAHSAFRSFAKLLPHLQGARESERRHRSQMRRKIFGTPCHFFFACLPVCQLEWIFAHADSYHVTLLGKRIYVHTYTADCCLCIFFFLWHAKIFVTLLDRNDIYYLLITTLLK